MDVKKLAGDLLGIVKAAAPDRHAADLGAVETLVKAVRATVEGVKGDLDSDDAAELGRTLAVLEAQVREHAKRTMNALG